MPEDAQSESPEFKIKMIGVESDQLADFQVPTFVNSTSIWHFGQDVYLDLALLTVEQMNALKPGEEVTVAVHDRYVMSPAVFRELAKQVDGALTKLKKEGLVPDGETSM
jgi:hypothetical protein